MRWGNLLTQQCVRRHVRTGWRTRSSPAFCLYFILIRRYANEVSVQVESVLDSDTLARRWLELASDPDSPDYYEVNEFGEVIMSLRRTNDHQRIVTAVTSALSQQLGPEAVQEVSVTTDRGIRVPDVIWMKPERWVQAKGKTPLPFVPDVCVEVLSPGNTNEEVTMKTNVFARRRTRGDRRWSSWRARVFRQ
jgi:hypothetical protein